MSAFQNVTNVVEGFVLDDDLTDEEVRAYISRLWGQDWECAEDAAYDALAASRDQEDEDPATGGIIPAGRTYLIGESDCCGSVGPGAGQQKETA